MCVCACECVCICAHAWVKDTVMTQNEWMNGEFTYIHREPDVAHLIHPLIPLHPSLSLLSLLPVLADDHTWSLLMLKFAASPLRLNACASIRASRCETNQWCQFNYTKVYKMTHICQILLKPALKEGEKKRKKLTKKELIQTVLPSQNKLSLQDVDVK